MESLFIVKTVRGNRPNRQPTPYAEAAASIASHPHLLHAVQHWIQKDYLEHLFPAPEASLREVLQCPEEYPNMKSWLLASWLPELVGLASAVERLQHFDAHLCRGSTFVRAIRPESIFIRRENDDSFRLRIGHLTSQTTENLRNSRAQSLVTKVFDAVNWYDQDQGQHWTLDLDLLKISDGPRRQCSAHNLEIEHFGYIILDILIFVMLETEKPENTASGIVDTITVSKEQKSHFREKSPLAALEVVRASWNREWSAKLGVCIDPIVDLVASLVSGGHEPFVTAKRVKETLAAVQSPPDFSA